MEKFVIEEKGWGKDKHLFPKQISETKAELLLKDGKIQVFDSKEQAEEKIKKLSETPLPQVH